MKIIKKLLPLVAAFCVATVIAQAILLGVLWQKGGLTEDKQLRLLALFRGVDVAAIKVNVKKERVASEPVAIRMKQRAANTEELTLRENSFRQTLASYKSLDADLREVRRQNELLKTSFDNRLARLERESIEDALLDVRQTLEAINTKQAKLQLLRMLKDGAMDDVIKLVTAMPVEKRKKIFSEFKSIDESEKLHDILLQMRNVADRSKSAGDTRES